QISHQCRHAIISTREPMVLDRHVLAFDVTSFVEAFAERGCAGLGGVERPSFDKSNNRHRWLLRARHKRPSDGSATQKPNELAPPHCSPKAQGQGIVLA